MRSAASAVALGLLALAGCSPDDEYWIRSGLRRAGLSGIVARCIADRLTDRYSFEELSPIAHEVRGHRIRAQSVDELLPQLQPLVKPHVYEGLQRIGRRCSSRW